MAMQMTRARKLNDPRWRGKYHWTVARRQVRSEVQGRQMYAYRGLLLMIVFPGLGAGNSHLSKMAINTIYWCETILAYIVCVPILLKCLWQVLKGTPRIRIQSILYTTRKKSNLIYLRYHVKLQERKLFNEQSCPLTEFFDIRAANTGCLDCFRRIHHLLTKVNKDPQQIPWQDFHTKISEGWRRHDVSVQTVIHG